MNVRNRCEPKITVVMPVYNRADTVSRAIESILGQTFGDFEFVIVDDGSTDHTAAVIAGYADPRIRYLRQVRNLGGNVARNRGVREATSPLVAFIDSDDSFLPHKLAYVVEYFDRNPDTDALIDSFLLRYRPAKERGDAARVNPVLKDSTLVEEAVFARRIFKATPSLSAKRDALLGVGLFDETLKRRQDMDLVLRLAKHARCATTSEILWTKHWSPESISARQNTFMYAMIEMCRRHPQYLSRPEFRIGLAHDMARHFMRLMHEGSFSTVVTDARRFIAFDGGVSLARLVAEGICENVRRSLATRRTRS